MSHIIPVAWEHTDTDEHCPLLRLERCRGREGVVRYAIRQGGLCLNKNGKWEYEPLPSSRTEAFFRRCRWDRFEDAYAVFASLDPNGRFSDQIRYEQSQRPKGDAP